jgi:very-short-patch-repair endonuclease
MGLPQGLITGRAARLPTDLKKYPTISNSKERSGQELGFLRVWRMTCADLPQPERNYVFHPTRGWQLDFAWPDVLLAVEIEGLTRQGGGHQRSAGYRKDVKKYREAELLGWRIVRFTADEMKTSPIQSIELVAKILRERKGNQ